ncbi:LOW QUALITY PROTEIN: coronin-2A-like [Menidia menidia]
MSRRSSFRGSNFRQVFGKPANKEHSYDGVPITRSVHDNHFCSANPCFIAVVTECAGGGAFLVLPIRHRGRVDPQHPRVCGHGGRVLDVKWNPFDDLCVASCSEDCTVKIWDIPARGVRQNLTRARKTLAGHSRRVGLIEWHPTAQNLLLSAAYDCQVLLWDVSQAGAVIRVPVRVLLPPAPPHPPGALPLLSASFSGDGARLALASRDRRVQVLDPRGGRTLQVSSNRSHRASRVLFIRGLEMLLTTGSSRWNQRQIVLWDPDDLSEPLYEEDLDGSAGVLFPFYDPDTRLLYLAGKGDGNIRCYQLSSERPYVTFLTEHRSPLPQKGLGVMPKRGLDLRACEVFRFYRLIVVKDLVEPLSMIVPRKQPGVLQEAPPPPRAAMTAQEWLDGGPGFQTRLCPPPGPFAPPGPGRGGAPRPEAPLENPYAEPPPGGPGRPRPLRPRTGGRTENDQNLTEQAFLEEQLAYQDAKYPPPPGGLSEWQPDGTLPPPQGYCCTPHCLEPAERPPPPSESELLEAFYRQQDQIRGLREELHQREVRINQLELQVKNRNNLRATF